MSIDKKKLTYYLEEIDSRLEGLTRKIDIYCIGGTALTLRDDKYMSEDIDFVVSREDFRTLSGIVAEIERRDKIRIDMFPNGELIEYSLPYDFKSKSRKIGLFRYINLYSINQLDLILMKALAGRLKDRGDIRKFTGKINKESLIKRFNQLEFKKGMKEKLREKLDRFISEFKVS